MRRKRPLALDITKEAKGNVFVDCRIGGARISGQGNRFRNTVIAYSHFVTEHPKLWKLIVVGLVVAIISLIIEYWIFK
jgi:hypothetical protein